MKLKYASFLVIALMVFSCCEEDPVPPIEEDLTDIVYNPQPFEIIYPNYIIQVAGRDVSLPTMIIPEDNPMTEEGIELGRHLFYDNILSGDNTQSCSSCHLPEGSFTDNKAVSVGIDGIAGTRSSMSLFNVGFTENAFFWDGRSATLEEQALIPVEDPIELHNTWPNVVAELQEHDDYPTMFRKAFGISKKTEITKELAAKALAQFERSIYSFESKFDKYLEGKVLLEDDELYGLELYFEIDGTPDAQCSHCHSIPLIASNDFFNNGLQEAATFEDFVDKGRGAVIGINAKNGFFRAPTLRNIELSAPYMHDGSLQTLDEVMDHYISGGKPSISRDANVTDVQIVDEYEKQALIAFLKTLTDKSVYELERLQSPF